MTPTYSTFAVLTTLVLLLGITTSCYTCCENAGRTGRTKGLKRGGVHTSIHTASFSFLRSPINEIIYHQYPPKILQYHQYPHGVGEFFVFG